MLTGESLALVGTGFLLQGEIHAPLQVRRAILAVNLVDAGVYVLKNHLCKAKHVKVCDSSELLRHADIIGGRGEVISEKHYQRRHQRRFNDILIERLFRLSQLTTHLAGG